MNENHKNYVLKDGVPVEEPNLTVWSAWFEDTDNRRVGLEKVGDYRISTVFLGLNHQFGPGEPLLWESMAFDHDGETADMERCGGTIADARIMHRRMVDKIRRLLLK